LCKRLHLLLTISQIIRFSFTGDYHIQHRAVESCDGILSCMGGGTFFKVRGTSASQKNYRKLLWFVLQL